MDVSIMARNSTNKRGGWSFWKLLSIILVSLSGLLIARIKFFRGYQMFELTQESRKRLLQAYPPKFSMVDADHITHAYNVSRFDPMPLLPKTVEIIGYMCDESIECVVVNIDGTYRRPDGGIYHITLSRKPDRPARDSNALIAECGWITNEDELRVQAFPAFRPL